MKLPKNYLENLSATKYREYLKLLPNMRQESTRTFFTLALTFSALSFFGIFAINPTLTTIADLQKQLSDNRQVDQQLKTKINNLSSLEQQYNQLGLDLNNIYNAVPQSPSAPLLSAQIAAISNKNNLTITAYSVSAVQLAAKQTSTKVQSFTFTMQLEGNYNDMLNFTAELAKISRLITIESMEISKDTQTNNLMLSLRARQYFKLQ